jgi:CDGSH-type Zn-finger protein
MEINETNETQRTAEVRILKDGPIMLKGVFSFKDTSGKISFGEQELFICRCGGSANKPWCDGTHKKIGVAY